MVIIIFAGPHPTAKKQPSIGEGTEPEPTTEMVNVRKLAESATGVVLEVPRKYVFYNTDGGCSICAQSRLRVVGRSCECSSHTRDAPNDTDN